MLSNCDVGEDSWEPLDCKEIKPVNPKGNQPWIFIGRTDAEAPILWLPEVKNWLIRKDPDVGKDWRQEEKGMTEDEMVGWHHRLYGHEFEQALRVGDGQSKLVCCSPWGCKELGHNWATELNWTIYMVPPYRRFLCTCDSTSMDSTNFGSCSTVVFNNENKPCVSGPTQFKLVWPSVKCISV